MKSQLIHESIKLLQLIDSDWKLKKDLLNKYELIHEQMQNMLQMVENEIDNIKNVY